jgi:hypothetical protein
LNDNGRHIEKVTTVFLKDSKPFGQYFNLHLDLNQNSLKSEKSVGNHLTWLLGQNAFCPFFWTGQLILTIGQLKGQLKTVVITEPFRFF